jgi:hypothetical protein
MMPDGDWEIGRMPVRMGWFDRVKMCVGWDLTDRARMGKFRRCMDADLSDVIKDIGDQLAKFKGTQSLMSNKRFVRRLHSVLGEWLIGLLDGAFDEEYVGRRFAFGRKLLEIDLTFEDVILLEELTRRQLFGLAKDKLSDSPHVLSSTMHTLDKAFNIDLALIYSIYLEAREAEMERVLLDRFLSVTGFSRTLYENLADARSWRSEK